MFKVEDVYCDDKKVGDVLRALAGLVVGSPRPVPLINAENVGGRIRAQTGNGNLLTLFLQHLSKHKGDRITPKEVGAWLKAQGRSPLSSSYVVRQASDVGALKRQGRGNGSFYLIVKALPKPGAHK